MDASEVSTMRIRGDVAVTLAGTPVAIPGFTQRIVNAIQCVYALDELIE